MNTELKSLLEDIDNHNKKIYDEYVANGRKEKLDFSKTKKNWGTDVIPKKFWVDFDNLNQYRLRNKKYTILDIQLVLKNSNGDEVTNPIKVSYKEKGKRNASYCILTLDGRADINTLKPNNLDLIKVA